MKKLYFLMMVALVSLTAAAASHRTPATSDLKVNGRTFFDVENLTFKAAKAFTTSTMRKAPATPAKAEEEVTLKSFEGEFYWFYYDPRRNDSQGNPEEQQAVLDFSIVDEANGTVEITIVSGFSIKATIDLEAKTFTIANNQKVGVDEDGDVIFYLKPVDEDEGKIYAGMSDDKEVVGTIEGTNVTFPVLSVWALGTPDAEDLGFYFLAYANEFEKGLTWNSLGDGEFLVNILYPATNKAGADNTTTFKTEVYVCEEYPSVYKITNPLKLSYANIGLNDVSPDLIFDASDTSDVIISLTETLVGSQTYGAYYYFCIGLLGTEAEPIDDDLKCTLTRNGDKMTLNCPPNSLMIFTGTTQDIFYCSETAPTTLTFTQKADTNGIEDITVDDNAPVEYYNLQGIRVANPSNGVYIQRQGNKATKVRF